MTGGWIAAFLALWALMIVIAIAVLGVLRRVGAVLERAEAGIAAAAAGPGGVSVGTTLPPFEVADAEGVRLASRELLAQRALFLFMSAGCGPCGELARSLNSTGTTLEGVPLHIVVEGSPTPEELPLPAEVSVLRDSDETVRAAFQNSATPQAFLVAAGGEVLGSIVPGSMDDLRRLAARNRDGR